MRQLLDMIPASEIRVGDTLLGENDTPYAVVTEAETLPFSPEVSITFDSGETIDMHISNHVAVLRDKA